MGFSVMEDSGLVVTHVLYKAALVLAIVRWILSWALKVRSRDDDFSSSDAAHVPCSSWVSDHLSLTTFGEIVDRLPESKSSGDMTCAVCLNRLKKRDVVRELRNCSHVFHSHCIDKWIEFDQEDSQVHRTCPLCRAPLLRGGSYLSTVRPEPSWAVERLLYLFGDDLLISS